MATNYVPTRPWYAKKRHMLWYFPTLLVVAIIAATIAIGGGDQAAPVDTAAADPAPKADPAEPAADEAETAKLDEPAADGTFTFRVKGLECGVDEVGDQYFSDEPQGQFCLLDVVVRNKGDEAGTMFADNQYLLEADGTQHSADSAASFTHDPDSDAIWAQINPGNKVRAEIVFDIPKKADPVEAQLHDSPLSGGVLVDLAD